MYVYRVDVDVQGIKRHELREQRIINKSKWI